MALRKVRTDNDPLLRKNSRNVDKIDDRIKELIKDMKETMIHENGVGIAAVQVGILKKIIIVDPTANDEEVKLPFEYEVPIALINPEILEKDGSCILNEGCLSVPGVSGKVERPKHIKVKAMTEDGKEVLFDAYDYFARVISHEVDHLYGILFTDKLAEEEIRKNN